MAEPFQKCTKKPYVFYIILCVILSASVSPRQLIDQDDTEVSHSGIDIVHYTIALDILHFEKEEIKGHTDLQILSHQDQVQKITLDLLSMNVDSVWIDEIPVNTYVYDGTHLNIYLSEPMNSDQALMVSVFYHGHPVRDPVWGGFYFTDKYAYNMGVGMGSNPHPFGRCWYPCIDSFTDRASYDYFITVDSNNTAICPGALEEIMTHDDKTRTFHWALQSPIPTYLSSVSVGDYVGFFDTLPGRSGDIPVMIYVFPDDTNRAREAFKDVGQWLEVFEAYFGPYRWEKIGFVAVPFRGGAMEHATAISFSDRTFHDNGGSEDLLVHEFAHSWFGNLVTCATSGDMWLNEGWASYCEALYKQAAYGVQAFKEHVRANHLNVLQIVPEIDQNIPLFDVPVHKTYSRTVYDKGADAAHTIRYQVGDAQFFKILKAYFDAHAYQSMTTDNFRKFFEQYSQENYTDLFNFLIKDRGFTHFSVDSFQTSEISKGFEVRVFISQKLNGANGYTYGTKTELKFMDHQWNEDLQVTPVFGPQTIATFTVPFQPDLVLIDPEEKISDATIDEYKVISEPGDYMFTYPYFGIRVDVLTDSLFIRATRNYICPDTSISVAGGYILDQTGYWTIEGMMKPGLSCEARFFYQTFKYPGNDFLTMLKDRNWFDHLILLFRKEPGTRWNEIPIVRLGTNAAGVLSTQFVENGEYCLAVKK